MNKRSKLKATRQEILKINDCFAAFIVEIQKVKYEDLEEFEKNRDKYLKQTEYTCIGQSTIVSAKQDISAYLSDIGLFLKHLSKRMGKFLILGDWNTAWLNHLSDYPPCIEATKFLSQRINQDFSGGFILTLDEIKDFIPHLFWLTRCNASLPELFISFEHSKSIISLCKHGVLHIEYFNEQERLNIEKISTQMKFSKVETCSDPIEFDNFQGRKLIV